jgi:hypothetical protein
MQWGMACRWLSAATWTSRASTALHGLTRGPPALGVGPHGSLRSSQAPTQSNCFERRRIWWPRRLLRVLGFGSVRDKIRVPWPPIYRDFGLISKRILLRSRFAPSIELFSTLVWINPMGKNLGWLRAWDELGRRRRLTLGQLGRGCFARGRAGRLRLGRVGLRRSEGEGGGCWAGLGLRPSFGPQSVLLFKISFLFPNLFIIYKLI